MDKLKNKLKEDIDNIFDWYEENKDDEEKMVGKLVLCQQKIQENDIKASFEIAVLAFITTNNI